MLATLETKLGYSFKRPELLEQALTHPSLSYETQRASGQDNQRLEFLGDAVLQLILTHELFNRFSDFNEGALTKLRSRLVSRSALMEYAREIQLGDFLRMGRGEESSGGRSRPSALADAFEAVVAAVYLDGDYSAARQVVLNLLEDHLVLLTEQPIEVNPKGQLQELLQSKSTGSPNYTIISQEGPDHAKRFEANVEWSGEILGSGSGQSKKEAEIAAARMALQHPSLKKLLP
jgi:ribonuclease-3